MKNAELQVVLMKNLKADNAIPPPLVRRCTTTKIVFFIFKHFSPHIYSGKAFFRSHSFPVDFSSFGMLIINCYRTCFDWLYERWILIFHSSIYNLILTRREMMAILLCYNNNSLLVLSDIFSFTSSSHHRPPV